MDNATLRSLMGQIVVIGLDGNLRELGQGESPAQGEVVINELSASSEPTIQVVSQENSEPVNITEDVASVFEAIEQGDDPTQLGEEFEPAAGESDGSSPQATGVIDRTGAERLAATDFETIGLESLGLSETQILSLLELYFGGFFSQPSQIADVIIQDISSPTVNEGEDVNFDVTLDAPTSDETELVFSLDDGSASGGQEDSGADFLNNIVTITFEDGTEQQVSVDENGDFIIVVPSETTTFTVTVQTFNDELLEGDETFTLSGSTRNQQDPVTGTATISDDGDGPGENPDDDRPTVLSISDVTVNEGEPAVFEVVLSNQSESETSVTLTLADGSATGGSDFDNTSVLVTFSDGTSQSVSVAEDGSFTVMVPANDTDFSITVVTNNDEILEGDETFTLTASTPTQEEPAEGTATISDDGDGPGQNPDDDRPNVASITNTTVNEGEAATLVVNLSNPSTTNTLVTMQLAGDTATSGVDFSDTTVTITFSDNTSEVVLLNPDGTFEVNVPENTTTFSVTVDTFDDDILEGAETFTLTGTTSAQTTPAQGTGTIVDDGTGPGPDPDDDRPVVAAISSATVNEGDPATLDVTLSNPSTTNTVVSMTLADGTADGGVDYTDTSVIITYADNSTQVVAVNPDGTFDVTVPANDTSYSVTVNTTNDDVFEGPETFTLSGATSTQNTPAQGTGTIVDDGSGPGLEPDDDRPTVASITDTTVNEGDPATLDVTLSNPSTTDTVVSMTLADGTADGGVDYTDTSVIITYADNSTQVVAVNPDGTFDVTVPANDTSYSVTVNTTDDNVFEGPETFTLSGATSTQNTPAQGTGTIVDDGSGPGPDPDDDRPLVASISSATVNEGDPATLDVTMSNPSTTDTVVSMTLADGTTDGGVDYTDTSVTITYADNSTQVVAVSPDGTFDVTVPANDTTYSVTVNTNGDDIFEGPETFTLSGATSTQNIPAQGTGTIVDDGSGPGPDPDDDRPTVASISNATVNEGEPATLDVTLSNPSTTDTVVSMTLADGTADGGVDYTDTSVTITYADNSTQVVAVNPDGTFDVTVPANDTTYSVTVNTTNDDVFEGPETFTLSGATSTQNIPAQGTGTIVDNGSGPGPEPDDDRPVVASITDATVSEGDPATLDVTLSNSSTTDTVVSMTLADGTADGGVDYTETSVTITYADNSTQVVAVNPDGTFDVTVPANDTSYSVTVNTTSDNVFEGPETFTLSGSTSTQNTPAQGTGTIVDDGSGPGPEPDDDRPVVASISSTTVNEGDPATLDVTLSNPSTTETVVSMTLADGTADGGVDYTDTSVTITYADNSTQVVAVNPDGTFDVNVPANDTTYSVTVNTTGDDVFEGPETFTLSGSTSTQNTPAQGTGTIVDDGSGPGPEPDDDRPLVTAISSVTVNEGDPATLDVSLSNPSTTETVVSMMLADGTADGGVDYTDTSVTITYTDNSTQVVAVNPDGTFDVTVPANDTSYSVTVNTIDDDVFEGPETFTLSGSTSTQNTPAQGTGTIVDDGSGPGPEPDDDRPVVASISNATVNEGEPATLDVTMSNPSTTDTVVSMTLADGTADGGVDYTDTSVTITYSDNSTQVVAVNPDGTFDVTVPANDTSYSVTVNTIDDTDFESSETFTLDGATSIQNTPVQGTGTILDNDAAPAIGNVVDAIVSEEGLPDGIADTMGAPSDSTNSASFVGSFTVSDPDTTNVSVVLSGPNGLASGGEPVTWSWNANTQTLTASTASIASVATVVLTEPNAAGQGTWGYTITLLEPLDHPVNDVEDLIDFDLQISVSDGQTTSSQSMNVVVEDDCPHVPMSSQAVDVSLADIPEILTGNISFVGNESDAFSRTFGDVEVTALGFLSNESTDLGAAEINQTSSGIGVKSVGNNGYPLANEVDYRFANDTGVSEQLIIDLGDKIAFGAEIEFEKMFGGELEEGLASFYRDGVLIAQQAFNSDAASGDYAANFSVQQGGFDKVILEATGNGNGPNTADNSDFTVKSITFTGADSAIPIATAEGNLGALYGADGPGSIVLNGAESGLETLDGEAISVGIDPQNPNRLVGEANGELAFEVQLTPSTGKWEFFQYVPLTSPSGDGDIDFSYTITDNDGDSKAGNFAVNPYAPPIVEGVTLNVSEEGLGNAIADDFALNGFMDTTDSALDMDQLTLGQTVDSVALNVPTSNLTSNGEAITWALSNNDQLLVGSADGEEVIKISVNDTGAISTELLGPIDHPDTSGEDSLNIEVPVVVSNALGLTNSAVANVVIEDDSPDSTSIVHDVVAETKESANVQLIMDVSGSMRTGNRLQIMKDSATQLLNQYESIGQTRVQIIKYSGSATTYAIAGATWLTVDEAKAYIDTLTAGGATNYNRAINEAKDSWDDAGKLPSASNVSYFLSDGQPNPASSFINDARENSWIDHLTDSDNQITALAYGMGVNLMPDQLDRVAYDGFLNQDLDGVVVPDVTQLPPVMLQSVIQPVGGNLMYTTSPDTGIGADGGYISEIEHDGVTYSFDGTDLTVVDNNNDISHAFDDITMLLTIYIDSKHTLEVDLNDGAYAFYGAVGDTVETLDFDYVLTDNDGDQSENTLQFVIDENGGVNAASGGAANIIEAEVDVSHDILIGNDNEADIFRWVNDSLDSGTDLVRGFERDLDILDLNQVVEDAGHSTIEELLNSIDLNVDGEDLSLEITHNEGNSIQTIVIEKGASEFSDLIIGNMDFERDVLSALTKVNLDS
ncbi:Calx-beta domain-containing protein [Vibrio owensii]|uniref:Calx-beta domain-containing protein n=1 Tax=Vibrio owensii TaxID=696485 RepID=UPI0009B895D2|nr:Calx-beta domain-containing protein [Vibrio owensii]